MNKEIAWLITSSTKNIGDDFQCLAVKRFLSNSDIRIDREHMKNHQGDSVRMLVNGWFLHDEGGWPPSNCIDPAFVSIHISNVRQKNGVVPQSYMLSADGKKYLKEHQPIGCRDTYTYKILKKSGINAYFSGCMTLTLESRRENRGDYICLVDPNEKLVQFVKSKTKREIVIVNPEKGDWPADYNMRLQEAEKILKIYAEAHMVITGRLHGALPSLAMETPVLLLEGKYGDERYEGLKYLLHRTTLEDFYSEKFPIDFENPPKNPTEYLIIRQNLETIARKFVEDKMWELDYEKINQENLQAVESAKKRTERFCKMYGLESVAKREFISNARYKFRTIEHLMGR